MIPVISFIGFCIQKISECSLRLINRYKLSKLGSHGNNCHIEGRVNITCPNIYVGDNVYIPDGSTFLSVGARLIIGNNVMFGPNVTIVTGNHRYDIIGKYMSDVSVEEKLKEDDQDVIIDEDVWVGTGVIILKGVRIGKGSIIGAGTIVTKDIPPYSVVTNVLGFNVRPRFTPEQIELHESLISLSVSVQSE